jgi:molybdopterin-guanine dinucleotide biosynthesis protein A
LRYTAPMGRGSTPCSTFTASAIVLAGGQSQRLGQDKALLVLDSQPLLVRTLDRLAAISDDLIVVANDPGRYAHLQLGVRFVCDERPGVGSLMGIFSGLRVARHRYALVVACDMPFLNVSLLRHLLSLAPGYDVVVPRLGDEVEPLHAVYGQSCLPAIEQVLAQGRRRIIAFFDHVRVRHVLQGEIDSFDPEHLSFVNVNTPQDWERVQTLAVGQGG